MKLIVAEIQSITKHPDANKLNICQVFDGNQTYQVVCGASNVKLGLKSIFAPVGSTTPKGLQIKSAKIRGIDSFGMLCSARDLNVRAEDGIIDLAIDTKLGTALELIDVHFLSSTPWYSYKLVDNLYENLQTKKLTVSSKELDQSQFKLLSQTFYHEEKYLYRHYSV